MGHGGNLDQLIENRGMSHNPNRSQSEGGTKVCFYIDKKSSLYDRGKEFGCDAWFPCSFMFPLRLGGVK